VLSRVFRRLFLEHLSTAHRAGRLAFFGQHQPLIEARAFAQYLAPLRDVDWVVYAKQPFSGPAAVLTYLARYTHRIAISNRRLIAHDDRGVTFKWKDYRAKANQRYKTMRLTPEEFIRRFLIHVLPPGFHRIRHYGLLANGVRAKNLAQARALLGVLTPPQPTHAEAAEPDPTSPTFVCPSCGQAMRIIETFEPGYRPPAPPHRGGDPP
jgi:hypothetical protein